MPDRSPQNVTDAETTQTRPSSVHKGSHPFSCSQRKYRLIPTVATKTDGEKARSP